MDEILFTRIDIPKEVRKILDSKEQKICLYMTTEEKKLYKYGLDTFQNMLQAICDGDGEPIVHILGQSMEEMTLTEVVRKLGGEFVILRK